MYIPVLTQYNVKDVAESLKMQGYTKEVAINYITTRLVDKGIDLTPQVYKDFKLGWED